MPDDGDGSICDGFGASGEVPQCSSSGWMRVVMNRRRRCHRVRHDPGDAAYNKQGVIPWFVYVVCVIIVVIIVANWEFGMCSGTIVVVRTKDIKLQGTHQAQLLGSHTEESKSHTSGSVEVDTVDAMMDDDGVEKVAQACVGITL
jgi:hypothetical protein